MTPNVAIICVGGDGMGSIIYSWHKTAANNVKCQVTATYTEFNKTIVVKDILLDKERFLDHPWEDASLASLAEVAKKDIQEYLDNKATQKACQRASKLDAIPSLLN